MDSTAELLDDATNSDRVAVDPLVSPREVNGQCEGWLVEEWAALRANVWPGGAEEREAGLDLATVRVSAEEEPETKWVLKVTRPPSATSVLQKYVDRVNPVRKFEEGLLDGDRGTRRGNDNRKGWKANVMRNAEVAGTSNTTPYSGTKFG